MWDFIDDITHFRAPIFSFLYLFLSVKVAFVSDNFRGKMCGRWRVSRLKSVPIIIIRDHLWNLLSKVAFLYLLFLVDDWWNDFLTLQISSRLNVLVLEFIDLLKISRLWISEVLLADISTHDLTAANVKVIPGKIRANMILRASWRLVNIKLVLLLNSKITWVGGHSIKQVRQRLVGWNWVNGLARLIFIRILAGQRVKTSIILRLVGIIGRQYLL